MMSNRPFAVFDIDGTLVRWQLYHAIADALGRLGYFDSEAFKTIRSARMSWKKRAHEESFKDYEHQLVVEYEKLLSQLSVDQFNNASNAVFEEYKDQVYTYTRDLIKDLKRNNYLIFAISNSQREIVQKIANYYGFDDFIGAEYHKLNNKFTGKVTLPLNDKDAALSKLVTKHNASMENSIAVGDSEGDIAMLKAVSQPIAFNPSKKLFIAAKQNGWPVIIERKNMVFKLEPKDGSYILA